MWSTVYQRERPSSRPHRRELVQEASTYPRHRTDSTNVVSLSLGPRRENTMSDLANANTHPEAPTSPSSTRADDVFSGTRSRAFPPTRADTTARSGRSDPADGLA